MNPADDSHVTSRLIYKKKKKKKKKKKMKMPSTEYAKRFDG